MVVAAGRGGVEEDPLQVEVEGDLADGEPHPRLGPAVEPPPDRVPAAEARRRIAPRFGGLGAAADGVEGRAVIHLSSSLEAEKSGKSRKNRTRPVQCTSAFGV